MQHLKLTINMARNQLRKIKETDYPTSYYQADEDYHQRSNFSLSHKTSSFLFLLCKRLYRCVHAEYRLKIPEDAGMYQQADADRKGVVEQVLQSVTS